MGPRESCYFVCVCVCGVCACLQHGLEAPLWYILLFAAFWEKAQERVWISESMVGS